MIYIGKFLCIFPSAIDSSLGTLYCADRNNDFTCITTRSPSGAWSAAIFLVTDFFLIFFLHIIYEGYNKLFDKIVNKLHCICYAATFVCIGFTVAYIAWGDIRRDS